MTPQEIRNWNKEFEVNHLSDKVWQIRASIELAAQLAQLNENLVYITSRNLKVEVEPGQYPIRIEKP
jgi:hypothetical protein